MFVCRSRSRNRKRSKRRLELNANRAMVRTHHIRMNFSIENVGNKAFVYERIVNTPTHVALAGTKAV